MPPKKKAKTAGDAPAAAATTPRKGKAPAKKGLALFMKGRPGGSAAAAVSATVLANVGGAMGPTIFTTAGAQSTEVMSVLEPTDTVPYAAFYIKTVKATVKMPGRDDLVQNSNGFTNVYPIDEDAIACVAEASSEDTTIDVLMQAIADKFLAAFPNVTVHKGYVPLCEVLPPKSFAKWYKMKKDQDASIDIMFNDIYDWVPATSDLDADNAAALAYLKKGQNANALYASSQDG